MDKVSFNPKSIRGLGNIVSPKTASDFGEYNTQIGSAVDTVNGRQMTIYDSSYRKTERLVLNYDAFVEYTDSLSSFPVKATLYSVTGRYYVGRPLTCIVNNDTILTGTTNSRGEVTFNIPVEDIGAYSFKVQYSITTGGRLSGCDASGRTIVGLMNSIRLLSEHQFIEPATTNELVCILEGIISENETIPVPDMLVSFYEEYVLYRVKLASSLGHTFQTGDVVTFTARVSDEDGSAIPNQTVNFYEEYETVNLQITNSTPDIETSDTLTFTARLTNTEGGAVQGETVKFYEEYTPTSIRLTPSVRRVMETGDSCTFTANIRDSDGSIVQVPGTIVSFYEKYVLSNILLSASSSLVEMDEVVSFSAKVSDEDGSAIPGQQVLFYEVFEYADLSVDAVPNPFGVDDEVTMTALLRDTDGSRVWGPEVYFTTPIPDSDEFSITLDVDAEVIETTDTAELSATVLDDEDPVEDVGVFFYAEGDRLPEEVIIPVGSDILTLTVDDDSINIGESVTLTGVLTDLSSEPIEDASVSFYDGTSLIGSDTTDENGTATYTYTPASAGSSVLRAKSGDTSSNPVSVSVAKLSSTVSLSGSNITYGSNVSLSGTLSVGSGESVKIYQGSSLIDTVTTTTGGAFSKSVSGLGAGSYTFKAVYEGNSTYQGSNSSNVNITVSKATPTLAFAKSYPQGDVVVGESFSLGGVLIAGENQAVKIYQGNSLLDTVYTTSREIFSKSVTPAVAGSFTYKAVFEGDSNYNSVTSGNVTVTVVEPTVPTSITLETTKSTLSYHDSETCTLSATVLDEDDYPVEGEVVEFFNGTTSMGTRETGSDGVAQMGYSSSGVGDLTFKAVCGSLEDTVSVEDCLFYDACTSNAKASAWTIPSGVTSQYSSNGWKVSANAYKQVKLTDKLTSACSVEFTLMDYNGTSSYVPVSIFQYTNGDSTPNQMIITGGAGSSFNVLGTTISHAMVKGGIYRIEYTASNIKVYEGTTLLAQATNSIGFPTRYEFHIGANSRNVTYKDIKVKPL